MSEKQNKNVTVRVQKIKKNHIKQKLVFFLILAIGLVILAVFQSISVHMTLMHRIWQVHFSPQSSASYGNRYIWERYAVQSYKWCKSQYFFDLYPGCCDFCVRNSCGCMLRIFWRSCRYCYDENLRYMSCFPWACICHGDCSYSWGGIQNAVIALAVVSWPKYSRIARGQTLALKEEPYIHAAILAGDSSGQIMLRHILPNMLGPVLVTAMLDIGTMMMELAGLSFLGLGAQIPMAEWGSMMSSGRSMIQTYPWVVLSPGIAIFISVAIFNLLGDTVRDYLDPKNSRS